LANMFFFEISGIEALEKIFMIGVFPMPENTAAVLII